MGRANFLGGAMVPLSLSAHATLSMPFRTTYKSETKRFFVLKITVLIAVILGEIASKLGQDACQGPRKLSAA